MEQIGYEEYTLAGCLAIGIACAVLWTAARLHQWYHRRQHYITAAKLNALRPGCFMMNLPDREAGWGDDQ